ncbi:hypothetical protein [Devosia sp.]|jgi:hypothetical protein|nr:hypothetical protein [Devosia sp.]
MTVTNQDIYLLAELRRKDPAEALRIATLSGTQNKEQTNAGR